MKIAAFLFAPTWCKNVGTSTRLKRSARRLDQNDGHIHRTKCRQVQRTKLVDSCTVLKISASDSLSSLEPGQCREYICRSESNDSVQFYGILGASRFHSSYLKEKQPTTPDLTIHTTASFTAVKQTGNSSMRITYVDRNP
jgi:hypothetical protein